MKEENIIKIVRWGWGFGCLALHAFTGVNGSVILLAMVLLGAPIEMIRGDKEEES